MKKVIALSALLSVSANAQTVIEYDDGTIYTLQPGQEIYLSPTELYQKIEAGNDTTFRRQSPWSERDNVGNGTNPNQRVGSHEWCKSYVPWSEGLTFNMTYWQRLCDTNDDERYACGDLQFDQSPDGAVCSE